MLKKLTVIIGAGPCGLAAAKYAKQNGLNFVVMEKCGDLGGLWNPETGLVWKSMHTNNSKKNCRFSDFQWPSQPEIFPTNQQFFAYLKAYAEHFGILQHIRFNCEVQKLFQEPKTQSYVVITKQKEQLLEIHAQNVIIASGLFAEACTPKNIPGLQNFKGEISDSRKYKKHEDFVNKKVLVVGGSFTAVEIAADLANSAQLIYSVFRSPFFVLPRFVNYGQGFKIPSDLLSYVRRQDLSQPDPILSYENMANKQRRLVGLCSQQQKIPDLQISEDDLKQPISRAISTGYLENVFANKIIPKRTTIKEVKENSVVLNNGQTVQVDTIMFCTGCYSSLNYLSEEIKQIIKLEPWHPKHPTIMYKSILHPKLPNFYVLGIFRGILVPICEMQARMAISLIMGKGRHPSQEELWIGVKHEQKYRNIQKHIQSRFSYPEYCLQLTPHIDIECNLEELRQKQPQKFNKFINLPLVQHKTDTFKPQH